MLKALSCNKESAFFGIGPDCGIDQVIVEKLITRGDFLEKNIGDVDFFKQVVKRLCKKKQYFPSET